MIQTEINNYLTVLIRLVRETPILWDVDHPDYGLTVASDNAWKELVAQFNAMGQYTSVTVEDIRFSWNSLKLAYFRCEINKNEEHIFNQYSSLTWLPDSANKPEDRKHDSSFISTKEDELRHNDEPFMKHRYYSPLVLVHWSLLIVLFYIFNDLTFKHQIQKKEVGSTWINTMAVVFMVISSFSALFRAVGNGQQVNHGERPPVGYIMVLVFHLIPAIIMITINFCEEYLWAPEGKVESIASIFLYLGLTASNIYKSYFFFAKIDLQELPHEAACFLLEQVITLITLLSFVYALGVQDFLIFPVYILAETAPLLLYYLCLYCKRNTIFGRCLLIKKYHYKPSRIRNVFTIRFTEFVTHKHVWKSIKHAKKINA